jgi:calcineurin-like phosphoesterase family protein
LESPKNIWFTSDLHLSHSNIIGFCDRPFENVNIMNETLIENINSTLRRNNILYNLGDFAFGDKKTIQNYISRIKCRSHNLILGNHDRFRPTQYIEMGMTWATRFPIIFYDYIILSHHSMNLQKNSVFLNLFGHHHNNLPYRPSANSWNLSVEVTNYKPISLEQILDEAKKEGAEI